MNTQQLMEIGIERHLVGDLAGAGQHYKEALAQDPQYADAWNLSGVIAHQLGRPAEAVELIRHAISLNAAGAGFHLNLASTLMGQKRYREAEVAARRELELDADHIAAWNVLGNAMFEQGNVEEAMKSLEHVVSLDSRNAESWVNLGRVLLETGRLDAAYESTQCALDVQPRHFDALNNMGVIEKRRRNFANAKDWFERALAERPRSSRAAVNLGNTLQELGEYRAAEQAFHQALEIDPTNANAWNSCGMFFQAIGHIAGAIDCFEKSLAIDPLHHAGSNLLYALNLAPGSDRDTILQAHREWAAVREARATVFKFPTRDDSPRKIRLGYVSPDFRHHPLTGFLMPVMEAHDRKRFEIACYSELAQTDEVTARYRQLSNRWRTTSGMSDAAMAEAIRQDEIDILIDLAGHTANNRLGAFALRPAPVQVSMLGYLNTTGLSSMDYVITDDIRDPAAEDAFYTERLIRLPGGGCCWTPPANAPEVRPSPVAERGHITFGCTHRRNKLTDETLQMWSQILHAVPGSRLLIFHNTLQHSLELQAQIIGEASDAGLDADRIDLAWDTTGEYLIAYHEMDVLLEAIPWSSGTTALEAMWMGVPVPTIRGRLPCGRATAAALARLGLNDLVAASPAEYVNLVTQLVADTDRLTKLRADLRSSLQTTICDTRTFVTELEDAFTTIWQSWRTAA